MPLSRLLACLQKEVEDHSIKLRGDRVGKRGIRLPNCNIINHENKQALC